MFDLSRPSTLNALSQWESDFSQKSGADIPKVLVANKCDLSAAVTHEDIAEFAQSRGFKSWASCSAKTGQGVRELFGSLLAEVAKSQAAAPPLPSPPPPTTANLTDDVNDEEEDDGPVIFTAWRI